jgi:hypothetical protein
MQLVIKILYDITLVSTRILNNSLTNLRASKCQVAQKREHSEEQGSRPWERGCVLPCCFANQAKTNDLIVMSCSFL